MKQNTKKKQKTCAFVALGWGWTKLVRRVLKPKLGREDPEMYKENSRKVEMPKYSARTDIEYSLRKNVPEERSMAIRTDLKYFSAFKYSAYLIIRI